MEAADGAQDAAGEPAVSYHVGLWPHTPYIECDGANCDNRIYFGAGPAIPRCIERKLPPAEGWETTILEDKRYDHCPDCTAPAQRTTRRAR